MLNLKASKHPSRKIINLQQTKGITSRNIQKIYQYALNVMTPEINI